VNFTKMIGFICAKFLVNGSHASKILIMALSGKNSSRIFISHGSLLVALVALAGLSFFSMKVLASHGWDPKAFVMVRNPSLPAEQKWGIGYDGQYSYALAVHPWGSTQDLDQPGYRYQRILYPLLVRLISLGQPGAVPWVMLGLNLAAAGLGCAGLGRLLQRRGAPPWLALVFIFSLGYLLAIRMDLLEPLALALALWGWALYEEDHPVLGVALLALSGLTKEIGLVFAAGLALWELLQRRPRRAAGLFFGCLAPYAAWYLILYQWFGTSAVQASQSRLLFPFSGLQFLNNPLSRGMVGIWVLVPAALAGLAAALELSHSGRAQPRPETALLLAQAALVAVMPAPTWEDPLAILRLGLGLLAVLLVWLAGTHRRLLPWAFALWAPSGLVLFFVPRML
jgi:hypothetical protein